MLRDLIGTQKTRQERFGYYLGGFILGPFSILVGMAMAIAQLLDKDSKDD